MCPHCRSLKWTALKCSGTGRVFRFTTHHHPPLANFVMPRTILLADMAEGFRLVGGLLGIQTGLSVRSQFVRPGDVATRQLTLGHSPTTRSQSSTQHHEWYGTTAGA
jgi:uncharacterized OB-fold protein